MSDIDILKSELTVDPLRRGYAGMDDRTAAVSLNTADRQVNRAAMAGDDLLQAVDVAEFARLTADKQAVVIGILNLAADAGVNPRGKSFALLSSVFGAGSLTIASLTTRRTETVTRAAELSIGVPKPGHVAEARRR